MLWECSWMLPAMPASSLVEGSKRKRSSSWGPSLKAMLCCVTKRIPRKCKANRLPTTHYSWKVNQNKKFSVMKGSIALSKIANSNDCSPSNMPSWKIIFFQWYCHCSENPWNATFGIILIFLEEKKMQCLVTVWSYLSVLITNIPQIMRNLLLVGGNIKFLFIQQISATFKDVGRVVVCTGL